MSKEINVRDAANILASNKAFLDVMRVLHKITAFDYCMPEGSKPEDVMRLNGKREVWGQLRNEMDLPPEVLSQIEHYKYMKDVD